MICLSLIMSFSLVASAETSEETRKRLKEEIAVYQQRKDTAEESKDDKSGTGLHSILKKDEYPKQALSSVYSGTAGILAQANATEQQSNDLSRYAVWGVLYDSSTIIQPYSYGQYNGGYTVSCSNDEFIWLKYVVAAEAGNQGLTGMQMVAEVVINRVLDSRFPNTIKDVIFAPGQFTPVSDGAFYTAYNSLPQSVQLECDTAVRNALSGTSAAQGAIYFRTAHYHNNTIPIMQYGAHYFSK